MNEETGRWLVVIVERHALWTLWCTDFVQKASVEKKNIEILDFSSFRLLRHERNSKYLLNRMYRKNRVENILRRIAFRCDINIIKPSILEYIRSPAIKFHSRNVASYVNGLDSQYFGETGTRITSVRQLNSKIVRQSSWVYDKVVEIVMREIIDRRITKVIVPGGRTLIPSAVIDGSQILGIECTVLEQITAQSTRYFEFPIDFRRDLRPLQKEIDNTWAKGDAQKYLEAQIYLDSKLQSPQLGRNFSANFDSKIEIPKPKNMKLASIFVGSSFEMAPTEIKRKKTDLGGEQQREMLQLFIKIAQENGFYVLLRGHPSSTGLERMFAAEDKEWAKFCKQNRIKHYDSLSKIDSYNLMKTSDINVFYASTAGVDSIILGANTLILAHTDWTHLVPELCAFDEPSIRNRFRSIDRKVNPKRLYPYAYFMRRGGIEMINVEYSSTKKALYFEGEEIGAPRLEFLEKIFKRRLK